MSIRREEGRVNKRREKEDTVKVMQGTRPSIHA